MSHRTRKKNNAAKNPFPKRAGSIVLALIVAGVLVWKWNTAVHPKDVTDSSTNSPHSAAGPQSMTSAVAQSTVRTNDPTALVEQGTEFFYKGDAEGALEKYSQALKLSPEDEEIHFNLARVYTVLGRTNDALGHYNKALTILPEYAEAHNNLGNLLVALKRHPEALEHFSAALKVNPDNSSALNNLGRCLAELGQTREAVVQFSEAVRLHPEYLEANFNLASAQATLGNLDEAIRNYEKVLQLEPEFAPAKEALRRVRAKQAQAAGKSP